MSERSERIIDTAPKAHGCTIHAKSITTAPDTMVHRMNERSERIIDTAPKAHRCTIHAKSITTAHDTMVHQ